MYQIAAFDLDGTIADTIPMCIEAVCTSVSAYTDHELTEQEIVQTFGLNEIGMIKALTAQNWRSALNDFYRKYELLHDEITAPYPGILNLLTFLKQTKTIIALITGKGEKSCSITLHKLGLSNVFDELLYGSQSAPNKKEHIAALLRKYSVSKDNFCYIGDTIEDFRTCQNAGVVCLSAAWQESAPVELLEKENPNHVFCCVKDLHHYLSCTQTQTQPNVLFY